MSNKIVQHWYIAFSSSLMLLFVQKIGNSRKKWVRPISGVAKAGHGRAHARPKHRVRPAHVTQSRVKCVQARG